MKDGLRLAIEQLNFCVGDIAGNADKIVRGMAAARDAGAGLAIFPEMALTGYPPEDLLLRDDFLRATRDALARIAEEARGLDALVGAPVRDGGVLYNSVLWLRDGQIHGRCDKRCLPNYGVFDERRYFAPGADAAVFTLDGVRVGVTVCEDLWDEETAASMRGADIVINCSASPFHVGKTAERRAMLGERARSLAAPVVYVNLVGGQDELVFDGDSCVADSGGDVVCALRRFVEDRAVCALGEIGVVGGAIASPPEDDAEEIWRALSLGLGDYVEKSGFEGVVVGVSGGIDSAVVLALSADVFGGERVRAMMLPSQYTSEASLEDARTLAANCGAHYEVAPIGDVLRAP